MQTTHNTFCIFKLFIDPFNISISGTICQSHSFQTFAADLIKFKRINKQTNDFMRRNFK